MVLIASYTFEDDSINGTTIENTINNINSSEYDLTLNNSSFNGLNSSIPPNGGYYSYKFDENIKLSKTLGVSYELNEGENLSISFWLKLDDLFSKQTILSTGQNNDSKKYGLDIIHELGVLECNIYDNTTDSTITLTIDDFIELNKWYHIVLTLNFVTLESNLYCNKMLFDNETITVLYGGLSEINVGMIYDDLNNEELTFTGYIDNLQIFNHSLEKDEINNLYDFNDYLENLENYIFTYLLTNDNSIDEKKAFRKSLVNLTTLYKK